MGHGLSKEHFEEVSKGLYKFKSSENSIILDLEKVEIEIKSTYPDKVDIYGTKRWCDCVRFVLADENLKKYSEKYNKIVSDIKKVLPKNLLARNCLINQHLEECKLYFLDGEFTSDKITIEINFFIRHSSDHEFTQVYEILNNIKIIENTPPL